MHKLRRLGVVGATIGGMAGLFFAVLLTFDRGWRTGVPAGIGGGIAFGIAVVVFESLWGLATRVLRLRRLPDRPSFAGETVML